VDLAGRSRLAELARVLALDPIGIERRRTDGRRPAARSNLPAPVRRTPPGFVELEWSRPGTRRVGVELELDDGRGSRLCLRVTDGEPGDVATIASLIWGGASMIQIRLACVASPEAALAKIDRRWIPERWLERLQQEEVLLYVFLALAGDKNGMSYWHPETIAERLALDVRRVETARHGLLQYGLVLFRYPKWQIIDLPEPSKRSSARN
jgi:hypothetical protein